MPAVLILILGSALGGVMRRWRRHADQGRDRESRHPHHRYARRDDQAAKLEDALLEVRPHQGALRNGALAGSRRRREPRVASGELAAALVIPKGFGAHLGDGQSVKLAGADRSRLRHGGRHLGERRASGGDALLGGDGRGANGVRGGAEQRLGAAGAVRAAPAQVAGLAVTQATKDDALDAVTVDDTVTSGAVKVTSLDYYALSMTAMFLMFGAMYGAFSTVRERREQTMSRMLASPTPSSAVVGGKMLGVFALGASQFVALYLFTRFALHVQWGASPAATLLVAFAEIAAVTGLATLISSIAKSERGVGGIGPLLVQVQALVGGAFFPVTILPSWLQSMRFLSVVGWAIEGWRRVQVEGLGVAGVIGPVAALVAFAMAFYAFGVWRTAARA